MSHLRERLTADHPLGSFHVGNATLASDETLKTTQHYTDPSIKDIENLPWGRLLSADELAYCRGRQYHDGMDVDSFEGIQWRHIVDDSVALCRTTGLWGSSNIDDKARVSCPFCIDLLRQEMRYEHPGVSISARRNGAHASAKIVFADDQIQLHVNGVLVRWEPVGTQDDFAWKTLHELADAINGAAGLASV